MVGDDFARVLVDAQGGSEEQFAVLWRDANPALLRYLRVIAPENAEDIAAETWVQVVRGLTRFTGDEGAWRAWLFTTARRRLLDHARLQRRHPAEPLDEINATEEPRSADTAQIALDNLATESAMALVNRLPTQQAEVIMLRVVAGLDTDAVADLLGKTPGSVRVTAHRGLKRLEALLCQAGVTSRAGVTL
ncbi:RNA polymerase sigma factor [Trebonia kvetii]|uniref:RNA polymerase sigma factor n=1 Tax=Trebonia kvetii TaxID=2480626 RepID=UPI001C9E61C2|nr:sigma-70 family RNA polymerase sigma factor [Trebonia kvetii]